MAKRPSSSRIPPSSAEKKSSFFRGIRHFCHCRKFFLLFLSFFLGLSLFLFLSHAVVFNKMTQFYLNSQGFKNVHIKHMDISSQSLIIEDISFLTPDQDLEVHIPHLSVSFDSLWNRHLQNIKITSPTLHIKEGEPPNWEKIRNQLKETLKNLQGLEEFNVTDGHLFSSISTPLTMTATLDPDKYVRLTLSHPQLAQVKIGLHYTPPSLQKAIPESLHLTCESPYFVQQQDDFMLEWKDLSIHIEEQQAMHELTVTGSLIKGEKASKNIPTIFLKKPLHMKAHIHHNGIDLEENTLSMGLFETPNNGKPLINISGTYNPLQKNLLLSLQSQPLSLLTWVEGQKFLKHLFPLLNLETATLSIQGSGQIPLSSDNLFPNIDQFKLHNLSLDLSHLNLTYDTLTLREGSTHIPLIPAFSSSSDEKGWHTQSDLFFRFGYLAIKNIPLSSGSLVYGLAGPSLFTLIPSPKRFEGRVFGGSFHLTNFTWKNPKNLSQGINCLFSFQNIDLSPLIALTQINELTLSGILSGDGNLELTPEGPFILNGHATVGSQGGILKYKAPKSIKTPESKLFLKALKDFHYNQLILDVESTNLAKRKSQTLIKISGSNPKVLNNYPFEINIKTLGRLQDLVKDSLQEVEKFN